MKLLVIREIMGMEANIGITSPTLYMAIVDVPDDTKLDPAGAAYFHERGGCGMIKGFFEAMKAQEAREAQEKAKKVPAKR